MTKLGIIGAMEIEVAILKSKLENQKVSKIGPMEFFEGKLSGCDVGIGMRGVVGNQVVAGQSVAASEETEE